MTKRLVVLIALTTGAIASPLIAAANAPSHNVGGERGIVFHDVRGEAARGDRFAMAQPLGDFGWRYVGGEAVWIYEGIANRSSGESARQTDRAPAPRTAERPLTLQRAQASNNIYHGA